MINEIGRWWLSGAKYEFSAQAAGASWTIPVEKALRYYGLSLNACRDIHDVIRVFRGRWFWRPDPWFQAGDIVLPPDQLLAAGGDDCDGWAMTHCQAINAALGRYGWRAVIVSYLADPFTVSHHYVAAIDPHGRVWVVQPQPDETNWTKYGEANQTVYGPYKTIEETVSVVAGWYNAKPIWWDRRDDWYRPA